MQQGSDPISSEAIAESSGSGRHFAQLLRTQGSKGLRVIVGS